jgi:predicted  nucleic acid-binding Zn-ribbon protein
VKVKKLLDKLTDILSDERHAQMEKYKSLKKVLKALRVEKVKLEKELANTTDPQPRHDIESRLKIISKQRKKGREVLKGLKKERKQKG